MARRANSASLGNLAAIEAVAPAARPLNSRAVNDRASRLAATDRLPAHAVRADHRNGSSVVARVARVAPVVIAVAADHRAAIGARGMKVHRSRFSFRRRR